MIPNIKARAHEIAKDDTGEYTLDESFLAIAVCALLPVLEAAESQDQRDLINAIRDARKVIAKE